MTLGVALAGIGCAAGSRPRVVEVSGAKRTWTVSPGQESFFVRDRASGLRSAPRKLPASQQCEEFYVRWKPDTIGLVKFEYRQVRFPGRILEQSFVPDVHPGTTFRICGDDYAEGGDVSAWRVTLWQDDALVGEQKSALW